MTLVLLLSVSVVSVGPGAGEPPSGVYFPPPGEAIENQASRRLPEVGLKSEVIRQLKAKARGGRWALWRHGYLVHVEGDFNRRAEVKSLRKTWHALTVGAAIKQGRIPSVHQKINVWVRDLEGNDAEATWWHVITQSSGFDYPYGGHPDYKPGVMWTYSDKNPKHLCNALARVYGKKGYRDHYADVVRAAYFDAIGMRGWRTAPAGDGIRFYFDLEDMGRLGLLVLARGTWKGKEIIPQSFVEQLQTKQTSDMLVNYKGPDDGRIGLDPKQFPEAPYGFMTWVNTDGNCYPGADKAWAWGAGAGGTYVLWHHRNGIVFAGVGMDTGPKEHGIPHVIEANIAGPNPLVRASGSKPSVSRPAGAPYPPSPVIAGVAFDWSTHVRLAPGSDNWPITWADDGHQYTCWGDGGGFGGTNSRGRVSLGFARVEGGPTDYKGFNVWGGRQPENPAQFGGKCYGIISVDGVLYAWWGGGSGNAFAQETRLLKSTDRGRTWTKSSWAFTRKESLYGGSFLNFGRDNAGARDEYVYSYFPRGASWALHKPGQADLARVPRARIMDRSVHEFFAGFDATGKPTWTKALEERKPVFEDRNGGLRTVSVGYDPGLKRYLLTTQHTKVGTGKGTGNLGIFDAPEPWGPWTTVAYIRNWRNGEDEEITGAISFYFAPKWFSPDGRDFTLVFTDADRWATVRGRFELRSEGSVEERP